MKAIHNPYDYRLDNSLVVYDPAKLVKMKAIHNLNQFLNFLNIVVYDPAKLVKMKAIHNYFFGGHYVSGLFMTLQS